MVDVESEARAIEIAARWPDASRFAMEVRADDAHVERRRLRWRTSCARLAPQVLGVLVRRHGRFDACEDAVQEALLAASQQWPSAGVPDNPYGWLITVATRRLTDELRAESSRARREEAVFVADVAPAVEPPGHDDTLTLLFLCCHPALSGASQVALTLRAVGGLTTGEIAQAFLVPEATMAQRISRAKATLRKSDVPFEAPAAAEFADRLQVVLQVLYLIFNEGYLASSGTELSRADLSAEAIRLARMLHALLPDDGEVGGLLALMLLIDARRAARTRADGSLVPMDEQDRSLWDADAIREGEALVTAALSSGPVGPYQLQAAIAAVHASAASAGETDWREIVALYELLERIAPEPGRHAQPRRRGGDGARSAGGPGAARLRDRRARHRTPPAVRRARAPEGARGRRDRRPRGLSRGRPADDVAAGAPLPRREGR